MKNKINKFNIDSTINIINKKKNKKTDNMIKKNKTNLNIQQKKIKYPLHKNIIINILNEYCKSKKKNCIKMAHLIKKRKRKNNIEKKFIKEKKTHSHKKLIKKSILTK